MDRSGEGSGRKEDPGQDNGMEDRGRGFSEQEEWGRSTEFAQMLEQYESARETETPAVGTQVRGRIVLITESTTFVDFGGRSEGAIETLHFRDPSGKITAEIGMVVNLFVVDNTDQVLLAPSVKAEPALALSQVLDARRTGVPISGRVSGLNTGGLEVEIAGLRGFCPVSQVDAGYCPDPSIYLGRTLEFLVTEVADGGKRLVVSRKALLRRQEEERAHELIGRLKEGVELEGTVTRIEPFGAFVDLGGVDGLVHVSEIRYERTESPSDVLSIGQTVKVKVLGIKEGEGGRTKISLSMKAATPDPWEEVGDRYWAGQRVQGTVVRLADFGAFINLSPGIDGLAHVSEVSLRPVAHPRDALQQGQTVDAVVLSVDPEKRRISLSIKDALAMMEGVAVDMGEAPAVDSSGGDAGVGAGASAGLTAGAGASGSSEGPSQTAAFTAGAPRTGTSAGAAPSAEPAAPKSGDLADGWVAGIKPYGLFVDIPKYGHRARGLVPHEETGEKRGVDLARRFRVGDQLKVEITDVDAEGKIRLSLVRARDREQQAGFQSFQATATPSRPPDTAMAEALRKAMEKQNPK